MSSSQPTEPHLANTLPGNHGPIYVDELKPGEELDGRYRIVRFLGSGGMGTVYEAEQIKLRRRVALKIMHPERAARRKNSHRFLREAQAASSVAHPNVVDILDFGELPGGIDYLVMELLEGSDLAGLIEEEGTLDWPRTRAILLQVLRGLRAAHDAKIIHRDIKPANIFLLAGEGDDGARVKVLDFGIARFDQGATQSQKLTGTAEMLGTVSYMAPEVALAKPATVQSDVYAVGILAYEMLTGTTPFTGEGPLQLMYAQIHEEPPRPRSIEPKITRAVEAVILRALAKSPDERFDGTEAFERALLEIDDEGKGPGRAITGRFSRGGSAGDRRRLGRFALVFLLVFGLGVVAWMRLGAESIAPSTAVVASARDDATAARTPEPAPSVPKARNREGASAGSTTTGSTTAGGIAAGSTTAGSTEGGSTDPSSDGALAAPLEVAVHVDNQLRRAVELFSVEQDGSERLRVTIAAGDTQEVPAPIDSRWVARSTSGRLLREIVIEQADQDVVFERARKSTESGASEPASPEPPRTLRPSKPPRPTAKSMRSAAEKASRSCGKKNRSFFTRVEVDFTIGPGGAVEGASVRAPLRGTSVGSCVAKAIAKLRFPADHSGERKTWTLPL